MVTSVLCLSPAGLAASNEAWRSSSDTHLPSAPGPSAVASSPSAPAAPATVGYPEYPSLSPDGQTLVFSWGGDLWAVPTSGGAASRITVHPGEERRSTFSPDGTTLAFESTRDGTRNIYTCSLLSTPTGLVASAPVRITASDRPHALGTFTRDGKALLLSGTFEPTIYRTTRIYRVELTGSTNPTLAAGVAGGLISKVSEAFGGAPRMAADGSILFQRGSCPPQRPKYRGSGSLEVWRLTPAGAFEKLSNSPGNNFDAWPLPDGSFVFISSRDGQNNLYRAGPQGESAQPARQLTNFTPTAEERSIAAGVRDLAVSLDGRVAVFAVWDKLYRLDLTNASAKPEPITITAGADDATLDIQRVVADKDVTETALSPDGKTIALIARGEVFVRATAEGLPTRRVTFTTGRERDLAWSPDGRVLYFASDDPGLTSTGTSDPDAVVKNLGKYAIYAASVELAREDLDPKKPADADKPADKSTEKSDKPETPTADPKADPAKDEPKSDSPADKATDKKADGPTDDKKSDAAAKPAARKPKRPDFGKRWSEALRFTIEPVVNIDADARHPVPSPDARALLFTQGLGDLVLMNLESGAKVTVLESWDDAEAVWAPDSRHIVYSVSDLDFNSDIWLLDTGGADHLEDPTPFTPINLTRHPDLDYSPRLSADGKVLTFLSERGDRRDQTDVYQVYLDRDLEGMTAYERDEYVKKSADAASKRKPVETPLFALKRDAVAKRLEAEAAAKADSASKPDADAKPDADKPAEIAADKSSDKPTDAPARPRASRPKPEKLKLDADDAYLRIRRLGAASGSKSNLAVTPGADRVLFSTSVDGEPALVSVDHKGQDRKVLQAGPVSDVSMSLTGDRAAFIRQGQASSVPTKGGKVDALPIDAPMVIDVRAQQQQKFLEAARTFGDRHYHPTHKGLDWPALTRRYLPLAVATRTSSAFNRVLDHLFDELDGSHTGASGGPAYSAAPPGTGYLGVRTRPVPGGFEIVSILPESPATHKNSRLRAGDVILGIDGKRLATDDAALPAIDLDTALMGRAGRETLVELHRAKSADDASDKPASDKSTSDKAASDKPSAKPAPASPFIVIIPISGAQLTQLSYQEEVRVRRATVEKLSQGRLGYLHIRSMSEPEVREFERDLYAAAHGKEGLIIDVRDNGGGSTADILLSSLTAPNHAYTAPRGVDLKTVPRDAYPRDRRLIYAWTRPLNVLINQHSFSNAEIFAHAIKTTKRGRLVGTATFGGVISTGAFTLIDGTSIRMPFRGWYLADGTDLENNGAKPDVPVPQTPQDEAAGKDAQLEAAVTDLLSQLGQTSSAKP